MVVQVSETDYQRMTGLNAFAHRLLQHPEAGKLVEQAAKLVDPNIRTPRLEQAAAQQAPLVEVQKRLDELQQQLAAKEADQQKAAMLTEATQRWNDGVAALRRQGYTDDGIKQIEAIRDQKGIVDPLDAAAIFERNNPAPSPIMPGSTGGWNFAEALQDDSDEDLKKLIASKGENDALSDSIARKALNEVRSQNQSVRRY